MSDVADNLRSIQSDIAAACKPFHHDPKAITLVAVSKKQPDERIQAALDAGHKVYGENRVQEAYEHWEHRKKQYADLVLHLIGPLQSNKTKEAVALFDVIETVDRPKIAKYLAKEMKEQGRNLPCFIQVNTGEEEQKSGILPKDLPDFFKLCTEEHGLDIQGLMCIPPVDEAPALHFALLKNLAEEHNLSNLSMGMSADYDKAVQMGATHIRIGTGVFGRRPSEEAAA